MRIGGRIDSSRRPWTGRHTQGIEGREKFREAA
jgi:hypothetical protein